jgi:hypothetical protein
MRMAQFRHVGRKNLSVVSICPLYLLELVLTLILIGLSSTIKIEGPVPPFAEAFFSYAGAGAGARGAKLGLGVDAGWTSGRPKIMGLNGSAFGAINGGESEDSAGHGSPLVSEGTLE